MFALPFDRVLAPFRRPVAARDAVGAHAAMSPTRCEDDCDKRLRSEPIVWLSTADEQGVPHIVPVWFVWDGEAFYVFSKPHARKVRAIRRQPRVALALGEPRDDFDVQLIEGRATLLPTSSAELLRDSVIGREHARKYAGELFSLGIGPDEYAATYSAVVRVVPTRFLPWHGRGPRWTGSAAGRPATIAG
jgi:PPOX class probable F420-dependent enzyme